MVKILSNRNRLGSCRGAALVEGSIASLLFFSTIFMMFQSVRLVYLSGVASTLANCAARVAMAELPDDGLPANRPIANELKFNGPAPYLNTYTRYVKQRYCNGNPATGSTLCSSPPPQYSARELKAFNLCLAKAREYLPNYRTFQAGAVADWRQADNRLRAQPSQLWLVPTSDPQAAPGTGGAEAHDQHRGYFIRANNGLADAHPAGIGSLVSDADEPRSYTACIGTGVLGTTKVCRTAQAR